MSSTFTPFPMYDYPELMDAHRALWDRFAALVRRGGFSSEIRLTQICGYPLATSLHREWTAIAAPVYDVPFCKGATHCGLIVVRAETSYASLADIRGTRFALNSRDSNTGANLPRRLIAPLAVDGTFFGDIVETGSHIASLAAVQSGAADVAAIDNVTFALLAEHRPSAVNALRVLSATAPSPTLPFVTPATLDPQLKALLYDSLASAVEELRGSYPFDALHLTGVRRASLATYEPLLRLEKEAAAFGYGTLA